MDREEALRFVSNTAWDTWVDNEEVRRLLTKMRDTITSAQAPKAEAAAPPAKESARPKRSKSVATLKVVVVGDGAVGKTSLLVAYDEDKFVEEYVPTVFESKTKIVKHKGKQVSLQLFDTAGQEEYDRLRPLCYPDTSIVLLCFSVDNSTSFANIRNIWAAEVRYYLPCVPTLLVGLKTDLRDDKSGAPRPFNYDFVMRQEGEALAKKIGAAAYMEACSKTRAGVSEVFDKAISVCLKLRGITSLNSSECSSRCSSLTSSLASSMGATAYEPMSVSMVALLNESLLASAQSIDTDDSGSDESDSGSDESDEEPLGVSLFEKVQHE